MGWVNNSPTAETSPRDGCTDWSPTGECIGWAETRLKSPVAEGAVVTPRDECVGWTSNQCSTWNTHTPTDECVDWGPTNECVLWRRFR
jgi:hypothetical protein